ncbi:MAG: exosortase H-associated membrane protein [Candidatus Competibacteraceae bacterium]
MPRRPIDRFLVRVLLWLAPTFVIWYALGPLLLMPIAGWTHWVLTYGFPQAIAAVEPQGITVDIVTQFMTTSANVTLPPGAQAQLIFTINALQYTYGLPLLLALTLAAPTDIGDKLYRTMMGSMVFMLIPVWGIACDALKVLVFQMEPAIAEQMGTTPLTRELLALAYQLGYLILPAVAPILIWAAFHRDFLREWLPQTRQGQSISS